MHQDIFLWSSYVKSNAAFFIYFLLFFSIHICIWYSYHLTFTVPLLLLFLLFLLLVIMATTTEVVNFGYMEITLQSCYDLSGCSGRLYIQVLSNDNKVMCLRLVKFLASRDHDTQKMHFFCAHACPRVFTQVQIFVFLYIVSISGHLFTKVLLLYVFTTDIEVGQVTF